MDPIHQVLFNKDTLYEIVKHLNGFTEIMLVKLTCKRLRDTLNELIKCERPPELGDTRSIHYSVGPVKRVVKHRKGVLIDTISVKEPDHQGIGRDRTITEIAYSNYCGLEWLPDYLYIVTNSGVVTTRTQVFFVSKKFFEINFSTHEGTRESFERYAYGYDETQRQYILHRNDDYGKRIWSSGEPEDIKSFVRKFSTDKFGYKITCFLDEFVTKTIERPQIAHYKQKRIKLY
jgi:hypothetical protein